MIYKPIVEYFVDILIVDIDSISSENRLSLHSLSNHKTQCQEGDDHLVINGGLL